MQAERFKAGRHEKGSGYRFFVPEKINHEWSWQDRDLNLLLEQASMSVGALNSYAGLVPNIDLFIHLHVTKEAVVSSKIEGTKTNIDEALLHEEEVSPEKRDDWQEVRNYTDALNYAISELERLPLSSRLLRQTHKILLRGVRGEHKQPGEFRRSQNWIGGASLADATFIPPAHHYVEELMGDLEQFLHNDQIAVPTLVKAAIAHYQFETIHPFLDGNGRIGRLLITLFLVSEGRLGKPLLYLSSFFERNKTLYYDNMTRVREKNDMVQWLKYFLVGIHETGQQATATLSKVLHLKERTEETIHQTFGRRQPSGLQMLKHLFRQPMIQVKDIEAQLGLSPKAANDLVKAFADTGILHEISGQTRYRIFSFREYVDLFR